VYDADGDLFGGEFLQGVTEGFDGTVHIAFDDEVELLKVTQGQAATDLIEGDMFFSADALFAKDLAASVGDFLGLAFIGVDLEFFPACGAPLRPSSRTGEEGGASSMRLFLSLNMALTRPKYCPETTRSPLCRVPLCTRTVAT